MWGNCGDDILWGNPVGQARKKAILAIYIVQGWSGNVDRRVATVPNKTEALACYRSWGKGWRWDCSTSRVQVSVV